MFKFRQKKIQNSQILTEIFLKKWEETLETELDSRDKKEAAEEVRKRANTVS